MNFIDYILLAAVIAVTILIIWSMRRNKKKGVSSCGGTCAGCPMADKCADNKKDK